MAELHKHVLKELEKAELLLDQFPMIALNSGVTVCNFSSFHPYKFNTGETLPACTKETADRHKLTTIEDKTPRWKSLDSFDEKWLAEDHEPDWYDIKLTLKIPMHTIKDLKILAEMDKLDIIMVPYPIQSELNENWRKNADMYIIWCKSRTCRKIDPRDHSQGVYSNKFCQ
jgi:hypothetical protein